MVEMGPGAGDVDVVVGATVDGAATSVAGGLASSAADVVVAASIVVVVEALVTGGSVFGPLLPSELQLAIASAAAPTMSADRSRCPLIPL